MDFNQVNYDGDLEGRDSDELVGLVEDFEKAQEANVAEFNDAKEQMQEMLGDDADFDALFGEVQDFASAKSEIISEITEFDSFDGSPVSEADLKDADFNKVREYHVYFANLDAEAEEADAKEEEKPEFNDMGKRSPTHDDDKADEEFAKQHLSGMPGFNPQ
ncbi:hypothetical protein [Halomonas sp.]|uniref:hypothetical protein n=1 Tax=Halomonas sp. TaxID=1486246 RepID=UPI00356384A1